MHHGDYRSTNTTGVQRETAGFSSITFDESFVIRDLKILQGSQGLIVVMPSRKTTYPCPFCRIKNAFTANFCNQCGKAIRPVHIPTDAEGRRKLYADVAHPINSATRTYIIETVLVAYYRELELSQQPDYQSRYYRHDEHAA